MANIAKNGYRQQWTAGSFFLDVQCGKVVLTDGQIAGDYDGGHMKDLKLAGSLKEVPDIVHRLGILPQDWQQEKRGYGLTANLKKPCLSGVRVSTTLPTVALRR